MLIMKHERADIGRSIIAKKNANSQMQHCIIAWHICGPCMTHMWTMCDPYVTHM